MLIIKPKLQLTSDSITKASWLRLSERFMPHSKMLLDAIQHLLSLVRS